MCEREWEVFLKLEMEFKMYSTLGREVGVSIYRWGFKTSYWAEFFREDRLNRPRGSLNRLWSDYQPVCQSEWQTTTQSSQTVRNRLNRPREG